MLTPKPAGRRGQPRGHNVLGAKIRQARLRLVPEVTQTDLAARLSVRGISVDRPTITRIENGQRYLRDFEIREIARALKVSVAWLFGEKTLGDDARDILESRAAATRSVRRG